MKKYGILAYPAKHSLSPVMHMSAFEALGINATYEVFEIAPRNLDAFMKKVRKEPISGLSVSLPYKETVIPFLDFISEDALKIGAVNTILNKNGELIGYNTDYLGSNNALKGVLGNLNGKSATIVGAGGAARAIAFGLLLEGCSVVVVNRTKEKAVKIALDFAEQFRARIYGEGTSKKDKLWISDILIHATSLWLKKNAHDIWKSERSLPFFMSDIYLSNFKTVMDVCYNFKNGYENPFDTPLTDQLQYVDKKIKVITADKMLLYQAIEQFKIWTGKKAPIRVMQKALASAARKARKEYKK